ncbi:MAG: DUF3566 domain-containing protein [Acidimicrobiia bacterium]|nr:DUF3566 domain-containing protein [Acidimicrobiia bacterium]
MPVQRVRRVIRKIDPWTVLKVSLVFNAVMALVTVLGLVVFWSVFVNAGIPDRINELALTIGIENGITFDGAVYFRIAVLLAIVGTILMTGLFTLGAVVYNLISDLVGGVEFVVLEETTGAVPAARRVKLPVTVAPKEEAGGRGVRPLPKVAPLGAPGSPGDGEATRVPEAPPGGRAGRAVTDEANRQTGT